MHNSNVLNVSIYSSILFFFFLRKLYLIVILPLGPAYTCIVTITDPEEEVEKKPTN